MGVEGQASPQEEGTVALLLYDNTHYPSPPTKLNMKVKQDDTTESLMTKVSAQTGYKEDLFELHHNGKKLEGGKRVSDLSTKGLLLHINRGPYAKDSDFGNKPVVVRSDPLASVSTSASTAIVPYTGSGSTSSTSSASSSSTSYSGGGYSGVAYGPYSMGSSSRMTYNYTDWNKKSSTGFVGLSNQGATCYMNSLIQTLYMTPEFRNALYKWNFVETFQRLLQQEKTNNSTKEGENMEVDGPKLSPEELLEQKRKQKEKDSIPRQLQLLFARLQLRDQKAVKTKDLTNSFGWKESDAFTQHDVQELMRVLFDALEKVLRDTDQANLINDLYQGEMKDYVKCLECKYESSRTDKYLDIPLVIKGFGETRAVGSVEEALRKFCQVEILNGSNQYHCDRCAKKVDAEKGLKFANFPYLLALQLKRFDFDYDTMRRIKLNDRVTFPFFLDLNSFVSDEIRSSFSGTAPASSSTSNGSPASNVDEQLTSQFESKLDTNDTSAGADSENLQKKRKIAGAQSGDDVMEDSEDKGKEKDGASNDNSSAQQVEELLKNGPFVYELYSVLIHRGSALGGHYYAYIKSFDNGKWYDFNDSHVSEISESDIATTFGEDDSSRPRGMYQMFYSSANAYMLMYRRVSPNNVKAVSATEMPEELRKFVESETARHKKKQEEKEREREMVALKIYYQNQEQEIKVHNSTTLADTITKTAETVGVLGKFGPDCIRIRNYHSYQDLPAEPYDDPQQMDKTIDELKWYHSKTLLLETKEPHETFPEYNPSDMLLRVVRYNHHDNTFSNSEPLYVDREATLLDLKKAIEAKWRIPADKQRLVKEHATSSGPPAKFLNGDDQPLRNGLYVYEPAKIYVEYNDGPEEQSKSFAEIERTRNLMELKFNLPGKDDFTESLQISKKTTFKELKEMIAARIRLPVDDFKVSRGNINWKYELKNEKDNMEDCRLYDGTKLIVEKGKPMKEGETRFNFYFFDPEGKRVKDYVEELFELPIMEDTLVSDLKVMLAQKLKDEKQLEMDPKLMRLREIIARSPSTIYLDNNTLKQSASCLYNGKCLAVQAISAPETKTNDDIVIFIQRWYPSTYEVGPKEELVVREEMPIPEFKQLLSEKYGIANVGLGKAFGSWPGPDLLEVVDLDWDRKVTPYQSASSKAGTIGFAPLYLRDGDILFYRDNDEPLKTLAAEEKRKLEKESATKKRGGYSYYHKEEALHIKTDG